MMDLRKELKEAYEGLDDYEKLYLHNEVDGYDSIYSMDELDELLCNDSPLHIAEMACYGDFNPNDEFFNFNGYGNLNSFNCLDDWIDDDCIIDYVIEKEDPLYCDEFEKILDEYQEEKEQLQSIVEEVKEFMNEYDFYELNTFQFDEGLTAEEMENKIMNQIEEDPKVIVNYLETFENKEAESLIQDLKAFC